MLLGTQRKFCPVYTLEPAVTALLIYISPPLSLYVTLILEADAFALFGPGDNEENYRSWR